MTVLLSTLVLTAFSRSSFSEELYLFIFNLASPHCYPFLSVYIQGFFFTVSISVTSQDCPKCTCQFSNVNDLFVVGNKTWLLISLIYYKLCTRLLVINDAYLMFFIPKIDVSWYILHSFVCVQTLILMYKLGGFERITMWQYTKAQLVIIMNHNADHMKI